MRCHACEISSVTGRMRHRKVLGQEQSHSLYKKHWLPSELLEEVAAASMRPAHVERQLWVMDLFCGTESWREKQCTVKGWGYLGVDIIGETTQYGGGQGRYIGDLSETSVLTILGVAYSLCGLLPQDLLLVWSSPPCDTYR